ncbi:MAG: hypothetical protein AAGF75_04670 [Cyanobacteria bacterium P01_H01_bin.130]
MSKAFELGPAQKEGSESFATGIGGGRWGRWDGLVAETALNSGWVYRDRIAPKDAGRTVLDYYARYYRHSTRQAWGDRIDAGQIYLGDRRATPDQVLDVGQELRYDRPPWREPTVPLTFQVLYEDRDLMVVAKPSGLPVMPAGGYLDHTLLRQLKLHHCPRTPGDCPVPIHRLGRGVPRDWLSWRDRLRRDPNSPVTFAIANSPKPTGRSSMDCRKKILLP